MGTRMFCDHCGNTITTSNVYCYGPYSEVQELVYPSHQGGGAGVAGAVGGAGSVGVGQRTSMQWVSASSLTQVVTSKLVKVDLCNSCVSIWMERVRNLTKASEPDV